MPPIPTFMPLSPHRCFAAVGALLVAVLLSACAAAPELSAQTPDRVHAAPADYRHNDCDMLARFLPVMQHGYIVTAGFQHTVYGWHVSAIEQVQQEKGCNALLTSAAARAAAGGQLDVQLEPVTTGLARTLGMGAARGALVVQAPSGAGLRARDVIVEMAGQQVQTPAEVKAIAGLLAPGTTAPLRVWRAGSLIDLAVSVAAPPAALPTGTTIATRR